MHDVLGGGVSLVAVVVYGGAVHHLRASACPHHGTAGRADVARGRRVPSHRTAGGRFRQH